MRHLAKKFAERRRYLVSCGLLLVPFFALNAALTIFLPAPRSTTEFWRDIPAPLVQVENSFRLVVSVLPFLMPVAPISPIQRRGLIVYGVGTTLYFASWLAIVLAPDSMWPRSAVGFLAPAYTPLLWLVGLALLGQRLYWGGCYRWWMYLVAVGVFMVAHVGHATLVYARFH